MFGNKIRIYPKDNTDFFKIEDVNMTKIEKMCDVKYTSIEPYLTDLKKMELSLISHFLSFNVWSDQIRLEPRST